MRAASNKQAEEKKGRGEPQSYNSKEMDSATTWESLEVEVYIFPYLHLRPWPVGHLDYIPVKIWAMEQLSHTQTPETWKCGIINMFSFTLISLRCLVTQYYKTNSVPEYQLAFSLLTWTNGDSHNSSVLPVEWKRIYFTRVFFLILWLEFAMNFFKLRKTGLNVLNRKKKKHC